MGQIAGLAQESSGESKTQFQKEVDTFIKLISVLAITIGASCDTLATPRARASTDRPGHDLCSAHRSTVVQVLSSF